MTTKDNLFKILQALNPMKDSLWTEDGSPALNEVRRLAKDDTITRAQINEAYPGLTRDNHPKAPEKVKPTSEAAPAPETMTEAQMKTILDRRVRDAEQALNDAIRAVAEAQLAVTQAHQRIERATAERNRKFPAPSQAETIKAYLAAQTQVAEQRQIDMAMQRHNRRGEGRPSRPINNVGNAAMRA